MQMDKMNLQYVALFFLQLLRGSRCCSWTSRGSPVQSNTVSGYNITREGKCGYVCSHKGL
jgi:hypothetical protein